MTMQSRFIVAFGYFGSFTLFSFIYSWMFREVLLAPDGPQCLSSLTVYGTVFSWKDHRKPTITAYKVPRNWLWPSKTMLLTPLGFWISSIINESSCIPWYYFDPLCAVPDVVQFYTAVLLYLHSYLNPHSYTGDRTTTTYITWTSTDVFFYR